MNKKNPQIDVMLNLKNSAIKWIQSKGLGTEVAEDIFQQSLLKAFSTDSQNEEPKKITAWFYQILRNTMMDEYRREKKSHLNLEEYALERENILYKETEESLCQCVNELLEELPKDEKKILKDHFFEDITYKELSEIHRQTESTIRVKALRAREKLKLSLKTCCGMSSLTEAKNGCDC